MKKTIRCIRPAIVALSVLTVALASTSGQASNRQVATERFTEYADVIDVAPVYRDVRLREPREECWTEEQVRIIEQPRYEQPHAYRQQYRRDDRGSSNSALVGGLIGGVIGNQLGRGHSSGSRAGATIAGAIIGGTIANEAAADSARHRRTPTHRPHTVYESRPVEKCKRVYESRYEQRLQYYNVTYRYRGRTFTTRMPRDPGSRLELQVSVSPARR